MRDVILDSPFGQVEAIGDSRIGFAFGD